MSNPRGNPNLPGGSRKGIPNVVTRDIREMILGALSAGGGQHWLEQQMGKNPVAFMGLVGKIIPQQIDATIRRELPEMTREDLLALLESMRAARGRVIEHEADTASVEQASIPAPKKGKA